MPRRNKRRLTDHGRLLWRTYTEIRLHEMDNGEQQFIEEYLIGEPRYAGMCMACGHWRHLIVGAFCSTCVRGSYTEGNK